MKKNFLTKKLDKFDQNTSILLTLLMIFGFLVGNFFPLQSSILKYIIILGSVFGLVVLLVLPFLERNILKKIPFEKGLALEELTKEKLEKLGFVCESNIPTGWGDLDIYAEKDGNSYGIEVKNWSGTVVYKNGSLMHGNFDKTGELHRLLRNCKMYRDKKFGADSQKFIKPVIVFGYNTNFDVLDNKISINNTEVLVTSIHNIDQVIK